MTKRLHIYLLHLCSFINYIFKIIGLQYNYVSPPSTWEREDHEPKSLQIEGGGGGRRCRTPKSAPNSRPPSTTRSTASRGGGPTSRRSSSQHPNRKYILCISFYS